MQQAQLIQLLTDFSTAWNQHDVEQLMACMHPECRFETVAGDDVFGTRAPNPLTVITKKPITAAQEELRRNTRSRSAKLRIAEKK